MGGDYLVARCQGLQQRSRHLPQSTGQQLQDRGDQHVSGVRTQDCRQNQRAGGLS